jgi:hypothetical protein
MSKNYNYFSEYILRTNHFLQKVISEFKFDFRTNTDIDVFSSVLILVPGISIKLSRQV